MQLREETYTHCEAVVREQLGHVVEKIIVVLVQLDRLERDLRKQRLDPRRKLALDLPIFFRATPH